MLTEVVYGKRIKGEVIDFTMHECGGCGIPFFVPTQWLNDKVNNHGSFHCPNGCYRTFVGKTEAEKLKESIEVLKKEKEKSEEKLQNRWLDELNQRKKLERQIKHVHNGVCPCCNRTFANLKRHMQSKHPEIIK